MRQCYNQSVANWLVDTWRDLDLDSSPFFTLRLTQYAITMRHRVSDSSITDEILVALLELKESSKTSFHQTSSLNSFYNDLLVHKILLSLGNAHP